MKRTYCSMKRGRELFYFKQKAKFQLFLAALGNKVQNNMSLPWNFRVSQSKKNHLRSNFRFIWEAKTFFSRNDFFQKWLKLIGFREFQVFLKRNFGISVGSTTNNRMPDETEHFLTKFYDNNRHKRWLKGLGTKKPHWELTFITSKRLLGTNIRGRKGSFTSQISHSVWPKQIGVRNWSVLGAQVKLAGRQQIWIWNRT